MGRSAVANPRATQFLTAVLSSLPELSQWATTGLPWGIIYVSIFTLFIMHVASHLFATEKVLTTKLKLRGLRRCGKTAAQKLE